MTSTASQRLSRPAGSPLAAAGASCSGLGSTAKAPKGSPEASSCGRREYLFPRQSPAPSSGGAAEEALLQAAATGGGSSCSRAVPSSLSFSSAAPRLIGGGGDAAASVLSAVSTSFQPPPASIVPGLWKEICEGTGNKATAAASHVGDGKPAARGVSAAPSEVASGAGHLTAPMMPTSDPACACDITIPTSVVSSVGSVWQKQYQTEYGVGVSFSRGLRYQDVRMTNENSAGVCYIREADIPRIPDSCPPLQQKERNLAYIESLLTQLGVEKDPLGLKAARRAGRERNGPGRSSSTPALSSLVSAAPPRLTVRPALIARRRYQTGVIAKPKTPLVATAMGPAPCRAAQRVSPPSPPKHRPPAPVTGAYPSIL
eukprot:TRINITY_DN76904_c0_g1_i1.p1 TRINITY_DN76904_c0_g1~~TRINITY_DN76904_c0_g1_i1.p1  ORF type:complete len:372 (-),score=74.37 TRINITY_DN76904_c0_g1_i1:11-1126(-)